MSSLSEAAAAAAAAPIMSGGAKKKRRPAGTPDPDAEVVSLSPRTLLESDRYVCEICNQGFQRDQNLQMHRRRHKVPWKLLKRDPPPVLPTDPASASASAVKKRVFVCPEPTCLHHEPGHALGDLVGIKKHYRRKHSDRRQWVCGRCAKGYAVQSDYKAHLKTCGTRGHSCDCGKVFSRVESFIEHQDSCTANRSKEVNATSSSPSPTSADTTTITTAWPMPSTSICRPNIELQLLPSSTLIQLATTNYNDIAISSPTSSSEERSNLNLSLSLSNEEADHRAPRRGEEVEAAEREYEEAKRIRRQAQAELDKALLLREHAAKTIDSVLLQITCHSCKLKMWPPNSDDFPPTVHDTPFAPASH